MMNWSKRRVLLGGIALAIMIFIPIWVMQIVPWLTRIPENFSYQADVTSVDNFYNEETGEYEGESYSETNFSYDVVGTSEDALLVKNTFDVRSLDGQTIFKAEPVYAIDPVTGAHVPELGDRTREGYLFAPRWLEKGDDFVYWHADSNVPLTMSFVGEETLFGVRVYKYSASVTIDQTSALSFRPGVGTTRGVTLDTVNTIWVEPVTGYLVKQQDYSTDYYYYDLATGERIAPYNQFSNTFTDGSVQRHAEKAQTERNIVYALTFGIPAFLLLIVLTFLFIEFGPRGKGQRLFRYFPGFFVFIAVSTLTVVIFWGEKRLMEDALKSNLSYESQAIASLIGERFRIYTNALVAGRALFESSTGVTREEWKQFIEGTEVITEYPGILGMGYTVVVNPEDVSTFEASVRAEGYSEFKIIPETPRDFYTSIIYLEPFDEVNQRAFGYDMFTEPVRREAMRTARDTGSPASSGNVQLLQSTGSQIKSDFLIYVPVYENGMPTETVADRRTYLRGFVYAPFRGTESISAIVQPEDHNVDLQIYNGLKITPETLMYSSIDTSSTSSLDRFFEQSTVIYVAGHPWTIVFANRANVEMPWADKVILVGTLVSGLLLAFMAFGLVQSIILSREKAVRYANTLTEDLQKSAKMLEERNVDLQEKLVALDELNKTMVDRELRMVELKNRLKRYE